jgi:tryptophan synthase alpha chain
MNRLQQLLTRKNNILSVYYTAGFPNLNDTLSILKALESGGADIVEIGMPFSDPLADGTIIQQSSQQALKNGMSVNVLFNQLKEFRNVVSLPVVLMGYFNPVFKFGVERFVNKCVECGIDGVIIPDLPFDEYLDCYKNLFEKAGLENIFLVTPQTPEPRIRLIDEYTNSFIYLVSSASVTGTQDGISTQQTNYFKRIQSMQLKSPTLIGFGIGNQQSFQEACKYANGAIIGSAFVKMLGSSVTPVQDVDRFLKTIKP